MQNLYTIAIGLNAHYDPWSLSTQPVTPWPISLNHLDINLHYPI